MGRIKWSEGPLASQVRETERNGEISIAAFLSLYGCLSAHPLTPFSLSSVMQSSRGHRRQQQALLGQQQQPPPQQQPQQEAAAAALPIFVDDEFQAPRHQEQEQGRLLSPSAAQQPPQASLRCVSSLPSVGLPACLLACSHVPYVRVQ